MTHIKEILVRVIEELVEANSKEQLGGYFNELGCDINKELVKLGIPQIPIVFADIDDLTPEEEEEVARQAIHSIYRSRKAPFLCLFMPHTNCIFDFIPSKNGGYFCQLVDSP